MVRTGRPTNEALRSQRAQPGATVLIDAYSTSKRSPYFEVKDVPVKLQLFGADQGQTVQVYSIVKQPYGGYLEQPFLPNGAVILTSTNNSVLLDTSGRYLVVLEGDLGPICTLTKQVVGQDKDVEIRQPSGAQANRPNLFFDGTTLNAFSSIIEIQNVAWAFNAYGLTTESIQVYAVYGNGASYREEEYKYKGKSLTLTSDKNSISIQQSGRYRFVLVGDPTNIVLVGNPTRDKAEAGAGVDEYTDKDAQNAVGAILKDTTDIALEYDSNVPSITATIINPAIIALTGLDPVDGDILEFSVATDKWDTTKSPRLLYLDGGNF